MRTGYEKMLDAVMELSIVDSHEHIFQDEKEDMELDIFKTYLQHYFSVDLISAGMTWQEMNVVQNPAIPVIDRWNIAEKHWDNARLTGYGQSLDLAVKALYGEDRIDRNTIESLSKKFTEANKPGHYAHVLRDMCQIEFSVNDMIDEMRMLKSPLFKFVARVDQFVEPTCRLDFERISGLTGVRIRTLLDYEEACEKFLDIVLSDGHIGLKCGLAYRRPLLFEKVARHRAEETFNLISQQEHGGGADVRAFQDYMMRFICRGADKRGMFMQVHTGILEGNANHIPNSDPTQLSALIRENPNLRFDLFHIGYPYHEQLGAMVKMYPNAYADFAWAHIISPPVARRMLSDWIETMPSDKIVGFGGDYCFVDGVYGHQLIARRNVAKVLADKVEDGLMDFNRAKKIAKMILNENGKRVFLT